MKTADPELMRAINRFHVMDAIRRFGPVSRVEISQLTELSPTTVSAITAALLDDRLIIPLQVGAVRDAGRGRPRVMLKLNPDAAHVVGVKLAPDQITVAVTNFCADILRSLVAADPHRPPDGVRHRRPGRGRRAPLRRATRASTWPTSRRLRRPSGRRRAGGGRLPAKPDSSASATCRSAPISAHRLGVPASIDSDVNLVTLAEHWFGQARGLNDFLVVNVERSLGLGILHNGELFRGANGLSPDLGDLMVARFERRRRTARRRRLGGVRADRSRGAAARERADATLPSGTRRWRFCCSARPPAISAAPACSPPRARRWASPSPT